MKDCMCYADIETTAFHFVVAETWTLILLKNVLVSSFGNKGHVLIKYC